LRSGIIEGMGDRVEIVEYEPAWPALFTALGAHLREAIGGVAVRIDHVGSTSVPGLAAKPVIDVQISVLSLEPSNAFRVPLQDAGFGYRADNPDWTPRVSQSLVGVYASSAAFRPDAGARSRARRLRGSCGRSRSAGDPEAVVRIVLPAYESLPCHAVQHLGDGAGGHARSS
jgi:GrpB-like predicted nucleotidyltransferase (UPF0157 family)